MARLACVVAPGFPHHITQRGNRRQQTFFRDDDYQAYLDLVGEWCSAHDVEIWAYYLLLTMCIGLQFGISRWIQTRPLGEVHRRYAYGQLQRGLAWASLAKLIRLVRVGRKLPADAPRTVREIEPSSSRVSRGRQSRYRWSSAAAHARGRDDGVVTVGPLLELAPNWRSFLARVIRDEETKLLRSHEQTGRPLGDDDFLATLEENLGRILKKQKSGPKTLTND